MKLHSDCYFTHSLNVRGSSRQHVAKCCPCRASATSDNNGRRITRSLDAEERTTHSVAVKIVGAILGRRAHFSRQHGTANTESVSAAAAILYNRLLQFGLRLRRLLLERLRLLDKRFTPRQRRRRRRTTRIWFNVDVLKGIIGRLQWKVCAEIGGVGRNRRRTVVGGCEIILSVNVTSVVN